MAPAAAETAAAGPFAAGQRAYSQAFQQAELTRDRLQNLSGRVVEGATSVETSSLTERHTTGVPSWLRLGAPQALSSRYRIKRAGPPRQPNPRWRSREAHRSRTEPANQHVAPARPARGRRGERVRRRPPPPWRRSAHVAQVRTRCRFRRRSSRRCNHLDRGRRMQGRAGHDRFRAAPSSAAHPGSGQNQIVVRPGNADMTVGARGVPDPIHVTLRRPPRLRCSGPTPWLIMPSATAAAVHACLFPLLPPLRCGAARPRHAVK
jgi:hypothetical protein